MCFFPLISLYWNRYERNRMILQNRLKLQHAVSFINDSAYQHQANKREQLHQVQEENVIITLPFKSLAISSYFSKMSLHLIDQKCN